MAAPAESRTPNLHRAIKPSHQSADRRVAAATARRAKKSCSHRKEMNLSLPQKTLDTDRPSHGRATRSLRCGCDACFRVPVGLSPTRPFLFLRRFWVMSGLAVIRPQPAKAPVNGIENLSVSDLAISRQLTHTRASSGEGTSARSHKWKTGQHLLETVM